MDWENPAGTSYDGDAEKTLLGSHCLSKTEALDVGHGGAIPLDEKSPCLLGRCVGIPDQSISVQWVKAVHVIVNEIYTGKFICER